MITPQSIKELKDKLDIADVIGRDIKLKRSGANYSGLCPFHDEKSGSFTITQSKQMYKCFGCGEFGDAIKFVQKYHRKDFTEAVEMLASSYNITLEYAKDDESSKQKRAADKDAKQLMSEAVEFALKSYQKILLNASKDSDVWQYLTKRGYSYNTVIEWGLGYAPIEWKHITTPLINHKLYQPAEAAGLIKTKDGNTYDVYRNRIIIPIHDADGCLIGLAGRWLPTGNKQEDKDQAKYINPKESLLYQKSKVLFGLYQALNAKAFKRVDGVAPAASMTEGYFDVISLHENLVYGAIAGCGTSITKDQLKLIKKYTDHLMILTDGDKAGLNAANKLIDLCLIENLRTDIIQLPDGKDPDDYAKEYHQFLEPENGAFTN